MERLYYFFDLEYETVYRPPDLPYRLLLVSVGYVGLHWHAEAEILLVLDGRVRVRSHQGLTELNTGEMMILKPNELHSLVEVSSNLVLVVQVDEELLPRNTFGSPDTAYVLPPGSEMPEKELDRMRSALAEMALETWDEKKGHRAMALSSLHRFVGLADRFAAVRRSDHPNRPENTVNQSRVKKILDFFHSQYASRISLQDVADLINVSPSYASHVIKEGTGRSMQENLNFIRAGRAVNLLLTTDLKLIEVSMAAGFSDPKYFNRYFHRLFGCSPSQMKTNPDWRQAILNHYREGGLDPAYGRSQLEGYLQ